MDKVVFIDIETTELDPLRAWPIQIAAIAVDRETLSIIEKNEVKILFTEEYASKDALDRNHYDFDAWQLARPPREAAVALNGFLGRHATWKRTSSKGNVNTWCELAGHNIAAYDAVILKRWFDQLGIFPKTALWTTATIDTMHMARAVEFALCERWEDGYSLGALCKRFGIEVKKEHDALCDVEANVELAAVLKTYLVPGWKSG